MAARSVNSVSRRPMGTRAVWLLILLTAVAASFWQCSEDKPVAVVIPVDTLEFIDSVFPADGAINVPVGSCVRITFLRQMDTATMTSNKFHFDVDNIYSLSIDTLNAVMCAARGLNRATIYHVVIDSGIADTAGNVMTKPYSFSFRTESGHALISAISPTNSQTDVPLDARIEVTFTRGMNTATIIPSNIVVSNGVTGTLAYADRRLVFTPDDSLEPYQTYTVTLKGAVADSAGVTLGQDYSWTFTTLKTGNGFIQSIYPVDGAIQVPVGINIYIQFSVAIDPASLVPNNFTVSGGVTGAVSVIGTYKSSVNFNPTVDLQYGTSYTAAFHGDLTSTAGQTIHINRTWTFTTADTLPPEVISTSPPDGAANVFRKTNVSITFDKAINPASVTAGEFYLTGHASDRDQVSVSGATVTLNPFYDLPNSKQITAVFDGDVSDTKGHSTHIDKTWQFTTNPPFGLASRYPASGEGCIPLDASIRMLFSGILDSTTITSANFVFEEYNGSQLSGSLFSYDSIVEFRPDVPLVPLKEYKITVPAGIKDINGEILASSQSWRFSAKGENLLPLAIGNKWIYQADAHIDSIVIVRDTIISGKHYFIDQSKRSYRYENDTIETSFMNDPNVLPWPYRFGNLDCSWIPITITTDGATYRCQWFRKSFEMIDFAGNQSYYYSPDVGLVGYNSHYWTGVSGSDTYSSWRLLSYQLQK